MIYSTDFKEICGHINRLELVKYLDDLGWEKLETKRQFIVYFQKVINDELYQVDVPTNENTENYANAMYRVAKTIAETQDKSVEQTILELLNPMSDIVRVRIANDKVKDGTLLFEDAIQLYENAKKMVTASAMDVFSPKKYHNGRPYEVVQEFLDKCRFGQTEIGSYITSIVCPFYEITENKIKQLSIFNKEPEGADSFTRKTTNKLITSLSAIKETLDRGGDLEELTEPKNGDKQISINFLEALQSLNIDEPNSLLDVKMKWAPTIQSNRAAISSIDITGSYYEPIAACVDSAKKSLLEDRSKVIKGRVGGMDGAPNPAVRKSGLVKIIYLDENNQRKVIKALLNADDYGQAISAHLLGQWVEVSGTLDTEKKNTLVDCDFRLIE